MGRCGLGFFGVCRVEGGLIIRFSFINVARFCSVIFILGFCFGYMIFVVMGLVSFGGGRWVNGVSVFFWRMKDEVVF